ncbi:MAG: 2-amino-4-hydroxy-6-hydroxymethyldihydropteridine diphosphokinase [Draconibacterium sp.]
MHKVFLGLGGNIGNKKENFILVHQYITKILGPIQRASSVYEAPPWGFSSDDNFWNQVVEIETILEAEELLWRIKEIEGMFGRKPVREDEERYTSRPMDIDILYFDDAYFETKSLIVPHPRIQYRLFVLVPLVEIAPHFKHPLLRMDNLTLLENCQDKSIIKKVEIAE